MELIVKAKDIFLEYAGRDILDIEELEIYSYDRIGLVGDNGAGKTSLLKINRLNARTTGQLQRCQALRQHCPHRPTR